MLDKFLEKPDGDFGSIHIEGVQFHRLPGSSCDLPSLKWSPISNEPPRISTISLPSLGQVIFFSWADDVDAGFRDEIQTESNSNRLALFIPGSLDFKFTSHADGIGKSKVKNQNYPIIRLCRLVRLYKR